MQEKRIYRVGSCRVENFGIRKLVSLRKHPFLLALRRRGRFVSFHQYGISVAES